MRTTRDVLIDARQLIASMDTWTQGAYRAERNGRECYCALGALEKATGPNDERQLYTAAVRMLSIYLPLGYSIASLNDAPSISPEEAHAQVLALFDAALSNNGA